MRELAGCRACGHVEMVGRKGPPGARVGTCRCCGAPLEAVGLLGTRMLAQIRRYPWETAAAQRAPVEQRAA